MNAQPGEWDRSRFEYDHSTEIMIIKCISRGAFVINILTSMQSLANILQNLPNFEIAI